MHNAEVHNEKELLLRIAEGDEKAFAILFRTYYAILYNNALRYVKSEFWAEEIVQEVFTVLWTGRKKHYNIDNLAGWLHRLIWNKAVDRMRRQGAELKAQYTLQSIIGTENDNEIAAHKERMHSLLDSAVSNLPPQRQAIYRLRYQEKMSLDEIAKQLKITRNTVRNHLTIALDNIRSYLLQHGDLYVFCWLCWHLF